MGFVLTMLERKIRKRRESAINKYNSPKQTAEAYILDVAESQMAVNYDKLPVQNSNGNSIERAVINGIDRNNAYKWCKVVEQTIEHFEGTGKDTLIRLKYFDKVREWQLCDKLFIARTSLFSWIENILTYAAMLAIQEGLIKII